MEIQKIIPDIWRPWRIDTAKDHTIMLKNEANSQEFNIKNYITNPEDRKAFMRILDKNFQ